MKDRSNGYSALFVLILCAVGLYGTMTTPPPMEEEIVGPMALPWLSLGGAALCGILLAVRHFLSSATIDKKENKRAIFLTICYFIFFLIYIAGMLYISNIFLNTDEPIVAYGGGFSIATFLFLFTSMHMLGRRSLFELLGIPACVVGALLLVFGHYFKIILP